jgi:molybdopterin/thiamine biosynthesis adenylyltransferase
MVSSLAAIKVLVVVLLLRQRADAALLDQLLPAVDVVLDCSDNFATRHLVNAASVRHHKPLVAGAAIRFDGQLSVYDPRDDASPCYACVFPPDAGLEEALCSTMGVFAPVVGIIGTMQAAEALKLLSGAGQSLAGRLLMLDARAMEWNAVHIRRNTACSVCAARPAPTPPVAATALR